MIKVKKEFYKGKRKQIESYIEYKNNLKNGISIYLFSYGEWYILAEYKNDLLHSKYYSKNIKGEIYCYLYDKGVLIKKLGFVKDKDKVNAFVKNKINPSDWLDLKSGGIEWVF